jgi:hypothetical protein
MLALFPGSKPHREAAKVLRLPYFDWADQEMTNGDLPPLLIQERIHTRKGLVDNPFVRYTLPRDVLYLNSGDSTWRSSKFMQDVGWTAIYARKEIHRFFATSSWHEGCDRILARLHDSIHNWVGGWMAYIGFAAFDPIFMLHHANVDRLFDIWLYLFRTSPPRDSDLRPFRSDNGNYEQMRDHVHVSGRYIKTSMESQFLRGYLASLYNLVLV